MTCGFGTREEMEARLQRENERLVRRMLREERRAEREEEDACCTYCGGSGGADPAICRMCDGSGVAR